MYTSSSLSKKRTRYASISTKPKAQVSFSANIFFIRTKEAMKIQEDFQKVNSLKFDNSFYLVSIRYLDLNNLFFRIAICSLNLQVHSFIGLLAFKSFPQENELCKSRERIAFTENESPNSRERIPFAIFLSSMFLMGVSNSVSRHRCFFRCRKLFTLKNHWDNFNQT